jgi:hypothetical protein
VNKPKSVDVLPSITRLPQESSSNREPSGLVSIMETSSSTSIKASGGARVKIMLVGMKYCILIARISYIFLAYELPSFSPPSIKRSKPYIVGRIGVNA